MLICNYVPGYQPDVPISAAGWFQIRQYIVLVCRKYHKGIAAGSAVRGYNYEGLLEHFLEGQFDDTVYHSKKPEVVGRYWGFVKKFDAERQEQVDTSELHKQEWLSRW